MMTLMSYDDNHVELMMMLPMIINMAFFIHNPIKITESDKTSLAKMMASLSAGSNFNNVNSNGNNNREENEYEEDSFDEDSEEEEEEEEEGGRALSETGTYVLDKEEEEKQKVKKMMMVIKVTTCVRAERDGEGY